MRVSSAHAPAALSTQWTASLPARVVSHHASVFRALCGAHLVTCNPRFRSRRNPCSLPCGCPDSLCRLVNPSQQCQCFRECIESSLAPLPLSHSHNPHQASIFSPFLDQPTRSYCGLSTKPARGCAELVFKLSARESSVLTTYWSEFTLSS